MAKNNQLNMPTDASGVTAPTHQDDERADGRINPEQQHLDPDAVTREEQVALEKEQEESWDSKTSDQSSSEHSQRKSTGKQQSPKAARTTEHR